MRRTERRKPQPARSHPERKGREDKVDAAIDMTFPASDAPTPGPATGTEPPARPVDRKAPIITKEQIEAAAKGSRTSKRSRDCTAFRSNSGVAARVETRA
jgi:hypothetical protein